MRQSVGLARAGAGDHEQGPGTAFASNAMLYCLALRPIEFSWVASGDRHGRIWLLEDVSRKHVLILFATLSVGRTLILPKSAYGRWLGSEPDPHDLLVPFAESRW